MNTHGLREHSGRRLAWKAAAGGTREAIAPREDLARARALAMSKPPIWDKNNVGFWLTVCVLISLIFSVIYRALT